MNLLVVIGAGASYDCRPEYVKRDDVQKIPLANNLFAQGAFQERFLEQYHLLSVADTLRRKSKEKEINFDLEYELEEIATKQDLDTIQNLFKTRFYLHELITKISRQTLDATKSYTQYVGLLNQLKQWIAASPQDHFVSIVSFNYDDLLECAMEQVYNYSWGKTQEFKHLEQYYRNRNIKIFKPHGSINWGRKITDGDNNIFYNSPEELFKKFRTVEISNRFTIIDPTAIQDFNKSKDVAPCIATPFKTKTNFDECPRSMFDEMTSCINNADKLMTIGWKGAEQHFTSILAQNKRISGAYIINTNINTQLDAIYPNNILQKIKTTFSYFVEQKQPSTFTEILASFKN